MITTDQVVKIKEISHNECPRLLILYDSGEQDIVRAVSDVLGRGYYLASSPLALGSPIEDPIVGLECSTGLELESLQHTGMTLIAAHCLHSHDLRSERVTKICDFEYLYHNTEHCRRDLARFLSFVLGQDRSHDDLDRKERTTMLCPGFYDVTRDLPNLEVISLGVDAVELRVDLLRDPASIGKCGPLPGLRFVGEQVMLLRQRTELPIVYTIRCTKDRGRFPMDNPDIFYDYLRKAVQWGCEYIDVDLWLPKDIRRELYDQKGHSRIISTWHDFSGEFDWMSPAARHLFSEAALYGDIVKMVALVKHGKDNCDLEYFRSDVQRTWNTPFCGLNMGDVGQPSRMFNKVLTPLTHHMLPTTDLMGELSLAQTNSIMHCVDRSPSLDFYTIGPKHSRALNSFFEKCFNELEQHHRIAHVDHVSTGTIQSLLKGSTFAGASFNPPLSVDEAPCLHRLSRAASHIGQVDTITANPISGGHALVADNVTWKGIRRALTQDFVPSAYAGRTALILGDTEADAAAAVYASHSLKPGCVYTIGFSTPGSVQLQSMEDLKRAKKPFLIISCLRAGRSSTALAILKHYSESGSGVFLDLSSDVAGGCDLVSLASSLGWASCTSIDVKMWTMVQTMQLLVGATVPMKLLRLAGGSALCQ